jgi:hypothetical protein
MKSACLIVCGLLATARSSFAQPGAQDPQPQPYPPPPPQPYAPQPYGPPPGAPAYAQPSPMPPQAGGARTTFVSTTEKRLDVRLDSNAVCTTPCSLYVEPGRFVTLHLQDLPRSKLSVGYMPPGDFVVTAKPRADGAFATGVTFTALGGAAVVTGITLTAVGFGTHNNGMRTAGLITGLSGLAVTAYSIPLIKRSLPTASIGPAHGQPYAAPNQVGLAGSF